MPLSNAQLAALVERARQKPPPVGAPSALWRTQQVLLDTWLQDSPQGQQLLRDRTLEEARETVRELLARGLLDMQVIDLPGEQMRIEIWPTALALAGGADAPQASQTASAR